MDPKIEVACAVIRKGGKILITRRPKNSHLGGLWEFPGGKRLAAESLADCLKREVFEELLIRVIPTRFLQRVDCHYPKKWVSLYFYDCELLEGTPLAKGCIEYRWVWPFELKHYSFPPADESILRNLQRLY